MNKEEQLLQVTFSLQELLNGTKKELEDTKKRLNESESNRKLAWDVINNKDSQIDELNKKIEELEGGAKNE